MLKKRYEYIIEKSSGKSFRAVLRDRFGIIFIVDETLVNCGYMQDSKDMKGLTAFLNEIGILSKHYSIKILDQS